MGSSPISSLRVATSDLSIEPAVVTNMTDVHAAGSILDVDSMGKARPSLLSSNEIPSKVEERKSLFLTDEQKKNAKNVALENVKGSNTISNTKKAQGQVILSGLSLAIGAILAPFTGGLSLIPTAFVVFYGNAAALAMYGGNQFFIDDDKKADDDADKLEPVSHDEYLPPNNLGNKDNAEIEPDSTPVNPLKEVSENDQPDSAGVRSDKLNQRIVDEAAKAGEIVMPEYLIQRENIATIEHQAETEMVNNTFEWAILEDVGNSDDRAVLMKAIEQAANLSIADCIDYAPDIGQVDFTIPIEDVPELGDLNIALDPTCVASRAIQVDDNIKVFAIRNSEDIQEGVLPQIVSQEKLEIPQKFKFSIKAPEPIITTEGSSRLGSNRSSGIRNNMVEKSKPVSPPAFKQSPELVAKLSDPRIATHQLDTKNNDNNIKELNEPILSSLSKPSPKYTVNIPDRIITTQSSSGLGTNRSAGVRNNENGSNKPAEPISPFVSKQSPKSKAPISEGAVTSDSAKTIKNNINKFDELKTVRASPKYTVNIPDRIITTQSSSGLGANRSAGVRNNENGSNKPAEPISPFVSKQSPKSKAPISEGAVTSDSAKTIKNNINKFDELKTVRESPKYTVNIPNRIITTQSSSGLGNNRSAGVRNNENGINKTADVVPSLAAKSSSNLTAQISSPSASTHLVGDRNTDNRVKTAIPKQSPQYKVHIPDRVVTTQSSSGLGSNRSAGVRNNEAAVNQVAGQASSKIFKQEPNFTIQAIPPIVTTQGSSALGSNNSAGIRHNLTEIHNENISKIASLYWEKTGIDKPVPLSILGNALVTRPVNLSNLDIVIEKGKAS